MNYFISFVICLFNMSIMLIYKVSDTISYYHGDNKSGFIKTDKYTVF